MAEDGATTTNNTSNKKCSTNNVTSSGDEEILKSVSSSDLDTQQIPSAASMTTTPSSSRKRVFTFQKRWLHSLPIMEKTLPGGVSPGGAVLSVKRSGLIESSESADEPSTSMSSTSDSNDTASREVIVCMLCDDPASNRELMKVWSRMNCRRGRIENHLMSKHPEFMLLLKHKRDSEGDLAVQIFLQQMRDGRCNIRNEISLGLYSHLQRVGNQQQYANANVAASIGNKRAFATLANEVALREGAAMSYYGTGFPSPSSVKNAALPSSGAALSDNVGSNVDMETKRVKQTQEMPQSLALSSPSLASGTVPKTVDRSIVFAQSQLQQDAHHLSSLWHPFLSSKSIVITGGENEPIAAVATNIWLLGANVVLTFATTSAMESFTTNHLARIVEADGLEGHRGVFLPMLCSFQSKKEIEMWSQAVVAKSVRLDCLINFVNEVEDTTLNAEAIGSDHNNKLDPFSNAKRLQAICQSMAAHCFQFSSGGSIINITTQYHESHDNGAEHVMKSLAKDLEAQFIQVNSIVLQQHSKPSLSPLAERENDGSETGELLPLEPEQVAALIHTILFFMSPSSLSVSGSIVRLRPPPSHPVNASSVGSAAQAETTANPPASPATSESVDALAKTGAMC